MDSFFPAKKISVTGNPVRPDIVAVATIDKEEAVIFFGLHPGKKTVLVVGGSLGARSINEAIAGRIDDLVEAGLQVIWQTGKTDAAKWQETAARKTGIWVSDFIKEMQYAYAAADIVVSRAGAMAIAELCVVKKPVLFVPYPFAAEDHQTVNAQNLVRKNAALMVKDSEAKDKVVAMIIELANDEAHQKALRENIAKLAVNDADRKVAEQILDVIKK
jgi:UDP-N-acetylglucosamine--N-acetylmuramyl-(pentapeptide) pyrophosphoryl-undecaprenol N-acetylglucosamine transferase